MEIYIIFSRYKTYNTYFFIAANLKLSPLNIDFNLFLSACSLNMGYPFIFKNIVFGQDDQHINRFCFQNLQLPLLFQGV